MRESNALGSSLDKRLSFVSLAARAGVTAATCLTGVLLLIFLFFPMKNAAERLLSRANVVTEISWMGAKMSLGESEAAAALKPILDPSQPLQELSRNAAREIETLRPEEYERLMQIGLLANLCEFEKPSPRKRADVAIDYSLEEKKLVRIVDSPDTYLFVAASQREKAARPEASANGDPRFCYVLALTDLGRDVRTVLTQSLKPWFGGQGRAAPQKPAPATDKVAGL